MPDLKIDQPSPDAVAQFVGQAATELGVAASAAMAILGDRLGLYKAMAGAGPVGPPELAARTGCSERYVREWLCSQAAAEWLHFDEESERFVLPAAHTAALVDETSPMFLGGSIQLLHALYAEVDRLTVAFRDGEGTGWGDHHADLYQGVARFARASFPSLLPGWVEALGSVAGRLQAGGRALDIGCGHGPAVVALALAYPTARIDGVDHHAASIDAAQRAVSEAGVTERVTLAVGDAREPAAEQEGMYDLVLLLDCLHDMGDPLAAATAARRALAPGGAVLIVEPASSDRLAENFNPIGRFYYAVSTAFCMPSALSQPGGWALGNQAGPGRLIDICTGAGLSRVEQLDATPFNMVFWATA